MKKINSYKKFYLLFILTCATYTHSMESIQSLDAQRTEEEGVINDEDVLKVIQTAKPNKKLSLGGYYIAYSMKYICLNRNNPNEEYNEDLRNKFASIIDKMQKDQHLQGALIQFHSGNDCGFFVMISRSPYAQNSFELNYYQHVIEEKNAMYTIQRTCGDISQKVENIKHILKDKSLKIFPVSLTENRYKPLYRTLCHFFQTKWPRQIQEEEEEKNIPLELPILSLKTLNEMILNRDTHLAWQLSEQVKELTDCNKREIEKYIEERDRSGEWKQFFYDNKILFHGQRYLIHGAIKFLKDLKDLDLEKVFLNQRERIERNYQEAIQYFKDSQGVCSSLCLLWLISKDTKDPQFEKAYRDIVFWEKNENDMSLEGSYLNLPIENPQMMAKEDKFRKIESFIQHLRSLLGIAEGIETTGKNYEQLRQKSIEESIAKNIFEERFSLALSMKATLISHHELEKTLKVFMKEKRIMLLIRFSGKLINQHGLEIPAAHAMAAYQDEEGKLFFYDPNDPQGDRKVMTVNELTDLFWKRSQFLFPTSKEKKNITLRAYRFKK